MFDWCHFLASILCREDGEEEEMERLHEILWHTWHLHGSKSLLVLESFDRHYIYIYITAVVISSAFTITDEKFWLFNLAFIVSIYTPGARIWTPDYLVTWERVGNPAAVAGEVT